MRLTQLCGTPLQGQIKVTDYSPTLLICLNSYWAIDQIFLRTMGMMCSAPNFVK